MNNSMEKILRDAEGLTTQQTELLQDEPLFIYGTGMFAQDVQRVLQKHGFKLSGFLDHRYAHLQTVNDLPTCLPDDPSISLKQRRDATVILGIHNREANITKVVNNLKEFGFKNIVSSIDLYDHFAEELGARYWLTSRTYYSSHTKEIQFAYNLLSDERSREVFESLIRFRISGDYSLLPAPDMKHQYFPPDLPAWPQPIRFVDCGAYDGDTLHSLSSAGHKFEAVAAFEPDQDNFRKLSTYVSKNKLSNTSLFPCGVYSSTTQLTFDTGKGEASVASQTGKTTIQCVSLDECIPTFRPTLIKMDIEGVEMDALAGARQLIRDCRPTLAISVYHTPAHIWEIPSLINAIMKGNKARYSYHLRSHGFNCFDTILYAIPVHHNNNISSR